MIAKVKHVAFFPGHRESEKVLFIIHKHWWTLLYPLSKGLLVFLISLFLPLWWRTLGAFLFSANLLICLYLAWLIFWVGYIVYQYLVWQQDRTIVTTERLVDFEVKSLAHKQVREVALDQVSEITYVVKGWGATLFKFGDVIVRSPLGEMVLDFTPAPDRTQSQLTALVEEATKEPPVTVEELVDFLKERRL